MARTGGSWSCRRAARRDVLRGRQHRRSRPGGHLTVPTLWHFKCSHFSEKVRWALDHKRIAHRRRSLFPGWHALPTLAVSRQMQVPLLRVDGETIRDSTRILEYLEDRHPEPALYPDDPAARVRAVELEDFFDRLGPALRRVHYSLLVPHVDEAAAFFASASSGPVYRLYEPCYAALFGRLMPRSLGFAPEQVERSRLRVEEILGRFDAELQPSGYLVGDDFTVADLTVASLLSTFVFPAGYPYPLPVPFPEPVVEYRASLERFAALEWTRGIYAKHRPPSAEV